MDPNRERNSRDTQRYFFIIYVCLAILSVDIAVLVVLNLR